MPQELTEKEKKFLANAEKNFLRKTFVIYFVIVLNILIIGLQVYKIYQTRNIFYGYELIFYITLLSFIILNVWLHRKYLRIIKKLKD